MTRCLFVALAATLFVSCTRTQSDPTLVAGNARFEFLTPSLVRMEYSPSGTLRRCAHGRGAEAGLAEGRQVQSTRKDGWLIAATSDMTLRYRLQSGAFAAANLEVTWNDAAGSAHAGIRVTEGSARTSGGLPYSLDNVSQDNLPAGRSDLPRPRSMTSFRGSTCCSPRRSPDC